MAWKKYFTTVPSQAKITARLEQINKDSEKAGTSQKFSSYLPEVYAGAPNRIERYVAYDQADLDSEISRALDTIAEFCTQNADDDDPIPFRIIYKGDVTETEVELLKAALEQWCSINQFNKRIWRIFRNVIKYGDQFFIRDPETYELMWVDSSKVEKIIVNEAKGKAIEDYVIRDIDFNLQSLVATNPLVHDQYSFPGGYPRSSNPAAGAGNINYGQPTTPGSRTSRFYNPASSMQISANHVIHLSLSEGMDQYWPFGTSIIESVYKTYKQKDLLEDCILIYRIVRAPERRVFYIDTGQLQGQRATAYVERVKNEIYQRRMPNACLALDTKIYLLDGRLLPLRDIITEYNNGKTNWVYSADPNTGKIVPGKITWAGETRKQTQVVKLTLDNGESIVCTPDHKFPILGKGFVEAQSLQIGESFIPAYFREEKVYKKGNTYRQIFDPKTKQWVFVHRMVAEFFKDDLNLVKEHIHDEKYKDLSKKTVHHSDFDRYNNNPENLLRMNGKDHVRLHFDHTKQLWQDPVFRAKMLEPRVIKYDSTLFQKMHKIVSESKTNPTLSLKIAAKELSQNADFMNYFRESNTDQKNQSKLKRFTWAYLLSLVQSNGYATWSDYRNTLVNSDSISVDYSYYRFSDEIFNRFSEIYFAMKGSNQQTLIQLLKSDTKFMEEFNKVHKDSRVKKQFTVCYRYVRNLVEHYGYRSFVDFRKGNKNREWLNRDKTITKYNYTYEMLHVLRDEYKSLSNNIHYTQNKVGFKRLYPSLQKNEKFMAAYKSANPTSDKKKFGPDMFKEMIKHFGFKDYNDFVEKEKFINHRLVSIEWLETPCDTGTITVDGDEIYHNFHTFAIEGGIFTKNSGGGASIVDTAYNPISITEDFFLATNNEQRGNKIESLAAGENLGCFSLDTKIKLLDGRDLSIIDIEKEMKTGKELWTYSCHPVTGEIAPGLITWAGKTRSDAKVLRITLDNGEIITCTPDHKFPLRGIGFVEAKDLQVGTSLTALYTRNTVINKHRKADYTQYFDHIDQKYKYTHRMVANFMRDQGIDNSMFVFEQFKNSLKNVVHHKNFNRYDNSPSNLAFMNWYDHRKYHNKIGFTEDAQSKGTKASAEKINYLKIHKPEKYKQIIQKQIQGRAEWRATQCPDILNEIKTKISQGVKKFLSNASQEELEIRKIRSQMNLALALDAHIQKLETDVQYKETIVKNLMEGQKKIRKNDPVKWQQFCKSRSEANYRSWASGQRDHIHQNQQYQYTETMLNTVTKLYRNDPCQIQNLLTQINNSVEFNEEWKKINNSKHNQRKFKRFDRNHLTQLLSKFGLDWDSFRLANNQIVVDSNDTDFVKLIEFVKQSHSQEDFSKISGISRHTLIARAVRYGFHDYRMLKKYTEFMNHRIVSIEYLEETMDVGTLTVDGEEKYHDWHTYALSAGVFVKNSIDDLKYFNNKLMRGLGIPSSYLPTGPDDGTAVYNDGKVGTAFIQEYRFNKYCQRLQNLLQPTFDLEFKLFLKNRGLEIHSSLFQLGFNPPQSFSEYRSMALDSERVNLFSSVMNSDANKYMSKRYALARYLGWSEEDILENERLWKEENQNKIKNKLGVAPENLQQRGQVGLGNLGIRPEPGEEELGGLGGEEPSPEAGTTPESGGGVPPPPPETETPTETP